MKNQSFAPPVNRRRLNPSRQIKKCVQVALFLFIVLSSHAGLMAQSKVKATGTGNTTGHIANLSVTNTTPGDVVINSQTVYIPSDGIYQPYIAFIPETLIPPNGTSVIPVDGYCADVRTPPVPNGTTMPPITKWVPVQDPKTSIGEGTVNLIPRTPLPPFIPSDIPVITGSPGFTAFPEFPSVETDIIINWPDTDIPVKGIIDPVKDPDIYAPLLVEILEDIIDATDIILDDEKFPTPFAINPEKERESVIQQTFWIVTAELTGDPYKKDDFTTKVIQQFEATANQPVSALPEEQKESLNTGISDFWKTFQATGVEAKVISITSPGLDLDEGDIDLISDSPACECGHISFDLEIKRDREEVHSETHTATKANSVNGVRIEIDEFELGDSFDVSITNIQASCYCDETACEFYPAESDNSNKPGYTKTDVTKPGKAGIIIDNDEGGTIGTNGNNGCSHNSETWNSEGTSYSFELKTRDEHTNEKTVFQRLTIRTYCQLEDCRRTLCKRRIQLNFVKSIN